MTGHAWSPAVAAVPEAFGLCKISNEDRLCETKHKKSDMKTTRKKKEKRKKKHEMQLSVEV